MWWGGNLPGLLGVEAVCSWRYDWGHRDILLLLCTVLVFSGDILGRNWDKNLRLLLLAFYISGFYSPPLVFLDLRSTDESGGGGGGLTLFSLSLCLPLKVALFFLLFHFLYIHIPIEKIIINAMKGRNLTESIPPQWFQKSIQNDQLMKKTKVFSWIPFCRKAKTKVKTSSLRNVKITRLFPETSRKWYFHEFHLNASSGSLSYRRIWHSLNGFGGGGGLKPAAEFNI